MPMNKANQTVAFGMDVSTMTKEQLYTWMNYTAPPVETKCEAGFHKDANGNCIQMRRLNIVVGLTNIETT